jgi:hypothetical protein
MCACRYPTHFCHRLHALREYIGHVFVNGGLLWTIGMNRWIWSFEHGWSWNTSYTTSAMYIHANLLITDYPQLTAWPQTTTTQLHEAGVKCRPTQPLPADLSAFVADPSSKGTIVFAVGTSGTFLKAPAHLTQAVSEAFVSLHEYRIIWAYSGPPLPVDLGPHVRLMKWLPQNDLLAHEKTVLFITHGGLKRYTLIGLVFHCSSCSV